MATATRNNLTTAGVVCISYSFHQPSVKKLPERSQLVELCGRFWKHYVIRGLVHQSSHSTARVCAVRRTAVQLWTADLCKLCGATENTRKSTRLSPQTVSGAETSLKENFSLEQGPISPEKEPHVRILNIIPVPTHTHHSKYFDVVLKTTAKG
jgi:hypothetical protein